jgi:two-component system alkaline phosphatase synthesis response regulator PhoP
VKGGEDQNEGRALILVVERDLHVRALEKYFLEEAGFAVELVEDGQAALERARQVCPRILISEILVPKLDGLSVCRALKADARTRSIDVLIFSILAAEERAREAGADAYLRKPLNQDRLIDSVRELLRLHAHRDPALRGRPAVSGDNRKA